MCILNVFEDDNSDTISTQMSSREQIQIGRVMLRPVQLRFRH